MGFKTDCGGLALKAEIKLSNAASTWNTRLSQIGRTDDEIIIVTYSLCSVEYIANILSKREGGKGITIICNSKYEHIVSALKQRYPQAHFYVNPHAHAKLALISPSSVWLSSENFGRIKDTFDASVGIHSKDAYNYFFTQVQELLNSTESIEIKEAHNYVHPFLR